MKLRILPYGKVVEALIDQRPYIFIFIGKNAWKRARSFKDPYFPSTLVLPPNDSPFAYSWPVKDCEVYVLDTDVTRIAYVRGLFSCLFNFGSKVIKYVSLNNPMTEIKKDF